MKNIRFFLNHALTLKGEGVGGGGVSLCYLCNRILIMLHPYLIFYLFYPHPLNRGPITNNILCAVSSKVFKRFLGDNVFLQLLNRLAPENRFR